MNTETTKKATDQLIAHVKQAQDGQWQIQSLMSHILCTAELASKFSSVFGLGKLSYITGIVHDIGKASIDFQKKIRGASGYDIEAHIEGYGNTHVDHSTAGAQLLVERYGEHIGMLLAFVVAGHHGGLPDGSNPYCSCLKKRLNKDIPDYKEFEPFVRQYLNTIELPDFKTKKSDKNAHNDWFSLQFIIRMLFSSLTDADFLDTEWFMDSQNASLRQIDITMDSIGEVYDRYIEDLISNPVGMINKKRSGILIACKNAATQDPGIFSLTVPTGGGKTYSSMAFAIDHARVHKLRRIIYIIPYTSIITQNADVFRSVFRPLGDNVVLEHHSNLDPEKETPLNRVSSQNWDAPIIVTTNVQFFESFFSNRTSSNRKLHNIADSVLIFDEAQMIPVNFLEPCLRVIDELVNNYGCSALICTATQPVLSKDKGMEKGLDNVVEIINDPEELYKDFKRVEIVNEIEKSVDTKALAKRLSTYSQVLVIVNTKKEARELWECLANLVGKEDCFHLSTMMCPMHRKRTLKDIFSRVRTGKPCRVISTQLIEAGVDIDFPVVFRAVAGLDSIAQAAGRCNREGKQKKGKVYVFKGETMPPPGHLRQSAESGIRALKKFEDPLSLEAIEFYFNDFFWKKDMDEKKILDLCNEEPSDIKFKKIAANFRIISDCSKSVIVPFDNTIYELLDVLRNSFNNIVDRKTRREIQMYTVQLRENQFKILADGGNLEDIFNDGQYVFLHRKDMYDDKLGLKIDNSEFMDINSLIQ